MLIAIILRLMLEQWEDTWRLWVIPATPLLLVDAVGSYWEKGRKALKSNNEI